MWMSSGGTSSVVHTDSSDNIICVFRGQKSFILVDPSLHADKVGQFVCSVERSTKVKVW